jgi:hypothetical protein
LGDHDEPPPPETANTGSSGEQKTPNTDAESMIVHEAASVNGGLVPVTDAEQLADLATSGVSVELKQQIVASMLVAKIQGSESDLRVRLQNSEKDLGKARKQLADAKEEIGELHGDVRVRDATISHLREHKTRDAFLWALSTILFGIGGGFIGRNLPATIIPFVAGAVLFAYGWFGGSSKAEGPK